MNLIALIVGYLFFAGLFAWSIYKFKGAFRAVPAEERDLDARMLADPLYWRYSYSSGLMTERIGFGAIAAISLFVLVMVTRFVALNPPI